MAVFLGAVVQGFSRFAFSAVAVAILLQVQTPGLAISADDPVQPANPVLQPGAPAGAIVQGFSRFAFSAVAVAILLQVQTPGLAIPLMTWCSLLIQSFSLVPRREVVSAIVEDIDDLRPEADRQDFKGMALASLRHRWPCRE